MQRGFEEVNVRTSNSGEVRDIEELGQDERIQTGNENYSKEGGMKATRDENKECVREKIEDDEERMRTRADLNSA